jgi:nicotinamide-nucleotide amidase
MKIKTAVFITVGNEILSGDIQDSNMGYFAKRAAESGFRLVEYSGVRDDVAEISRALKRSAGRVSIVVVSGGLGPTDDDLTRESAGTAFGVKLIVNKRVLKKLKEYFKRRGFGFPESNVKQATFPSGAKIIENPAGTAPGFHMRYKTTDYIFLPGVPGEFRRMIDEKVLPFLSRKGKTIVLSRVYRLFGLPESTIGEMIREIDLNGFEVAFLPEFPEVNVKLTGIIKRGENPEELFLKAETKLKERFGEFIFGRDKDTMEAVVGRLLREKKMKVAIAESITGGLIGHRITEVPGSSEYFDRSVVTYSDRSKVQLLNVKEETLKRYGAVSEETAIEMARGVRTASRVEIGLSVTGIAGPGGGSEKKPVGTVFVGISTKESEFARHYLFRDMPRERVKILTAEVALDILRRYLLNPEKFKG